MTMLDGLYNCKLMKRYILLFLSTITLSLLAQPSPSMYFYPEVKSVLQATNKVDMRYRLGALGTNSGPTYVAAGTNGIQVVTNGATLTISYTNSSFSATNQIYASNVLGGATGGQIPFGGVATNATTNYNYALFLNADGTRRWDQIYATNIAGLSLTTYASNIVGGVGNGGQIPFGGVATNTTTNANSILYLNSDGTRRWAPRYVSTFLTNVAVVTVDCNVTDFLHVTNNVAITNTAPTGTPYHGQTLEYCFRDSGSGLAITWNPAFATAAALPSVTVANKHTWVLVQWDAVTSLWYCKGVLQE